MDPSDVERFWSHVTKLRRCWTFRPRLKGGYGYLQWEKKHQLAHRVSWQIHFGPIPEGERVLHQCDNPPCVRPDHLFLGTQRDNIRDMDLKLRRQQSKGETNHAKLTDLDVLAIRERYHPRVVTLQMLADEYGVSQPTIWNIVHRRKWRHL